MLRAPLASEVLPSFVAESYTCWFLPFPQRSHRTVGHNHPKNNFCVCECCLSVILHASVLYLTFSLPRKNKINALHPPNISYFFPVYLAVFLWTSFFLLVCFFSSFPVVFLSTVPRTGSSPPPEEQNNNPFPTASIQSQNERYLFYKLPMQSWLMLNLWSTVSSCFFPAALLPSVFFILYLCT